MKIEEVQLKGFGKWQDAMFRFAPGINVFAAPNEAGKSTLLQGIFAALYGMKRDYVKTARYLPEYEKYRPWHQGDYETIITYRLAGKTYRLHRYLAKEREQARIFLDPEWTELTDVYQEDRRRERNFLERHLGLTRSLFADITWIRREPLLAAEHLSPSLSDTENSNPVVNRILAELDRELTGIGKKERAENTLLGKAASLATQKEKELENAQTAWQVISQLSRQVAEWEEERQEQEQLRNRLLQKKQRWNQQEQAWQERWQKSHTSPDERQWEWWERTAATQEERRIHREARENLGTLYDSEEITGENPLQEAEGERLRADYEKGVLLRRKWEECHLDLARVATTTIASQSRADLSRSRTGQRSEKVWLWGIAGILGVLGAISFLVEQPIVGGVAFGLGVAVAGIAWMALQKTGNRQAVPPAEESKAMAEWPRLQQEVSRLDEELRRLMQTWGVPDWDAFLTMREERHGHLQTRESDRLAAKIAKRDRETAILNRWRESLRVCLEREKAQMESERDSWQSELSRAEGRLQELREETARASGEMGAHETISVAKAVSEHEEAISGLRQLQMKREALQLARDSLQEALAEWNRDVSPAVNQEASQAMDRITAGSYRDVRLDPRESFAVRLLEPTRQLVLEQEQCSTGTQDQLYFAQRLALHHHVSRQTEPLPLFLDDHFVHYDQERLKRTLAYVAELGEEHQIFLFTCQERELAVLEPFLGASLRHAVHNLN